LWKLHHRQTIFGKNLQGPRPFCGVGCDLELHVQDNEIVKVTSPADHYVTSGHLCIKGRFGFSFAQKK